MKNYLIRLVLLILLSNIANAQSKTILKQDLFSQNLTMQANQMAKLFIAGDFKNYLNYFHPLTVQLSGGESKMIELLSNQNAVIISKGMTINRIVFNPPSEIVKSKNELQSTISQHTELRSPKGTVITYTTLIVISTDNGKTWKFIDTANRDIHTTKKLFPSLSNKIILPPKQKPTIVNN